MALVRPLDVLILKQHDSFSVGVAVPQGSDFLLLRMGEGIEMSLTLRSLFRNPSVQTLSVRHITDAKATFDNIDADVQKLSGKLKQKTLLGNIVSLFGLLDDKQSSAILHTDEDGPARMPQRKYTPEMFVTFLLRYYQVLPQSIKSDRYSLHDYLHLDIDKLALPCMVNLDGVL
jgi:hypothetical protein